MRLSVMLIVAILLVGGIFVELDLRHQHAHANATHTIQTTTTTHSGPFTTVTQLSTDLHNACAAISDSAVAKAIGAGKTGKAGKAIIIHSTVQIDPGWETAPNYAGCIWGAYGHNPKQVNALELLAAVFPTPSRAASFYKSQVAGAGAEVVKPTAKFAPVTKAAFLPQPKGHSGGEIEVLSNRVTLRLTTLIRSRTVSKEKVLKDLESLATVAVSRLEHSTAPASWSATTTSTTRSARKHS